MVNNDNKLWKSLKQYQKNENSIENTHHEFQQGVTDDFDLKSLPNQSRRKFLAALGATSAILTTACSDYYDKGEIITYNKKPESVTYGKANYYASTLNDGKGILVKTREGRPLKIDGNPEHPVFKGKIDAAAQSTIMDLYDPGRLRFPVKKSDSKLLLFQKELPRAEWAKIDKEIVEKLNEAVKNGKEISLITGKVISPTQKKLFDEFATKYPTFKVYSLEQFNCSTRRKAWLDCYGTKELPSINWEKADAIIALESDFLGSEGNTAEQIRRYTLRRDVNNPAQFNRLFVIEADYSLTGANADYRLKLHPSEQIDLLLSLLNEMINRHGFTLPAGVNLDLSKYNYGKFVKEHNFNPTAADDLIRDIAIKRNKVLFYAGDTLPYEIHVVTNLINTVLNNSELFDFNNAENLYLDYTTYDEWRNLVNKMNAGQVGVLIHYDSNPVYLLPNDLNYKQASEKVPTLISLLELPNESILNSRYIIPINHSLESWGDFSIRKGIISLQQPIIAPLHDTRQKEAILLNWMIDNVEQYSHDIYHKYLKNNWQNNIYPNLNQGFDFFNFWYSALHDGVVTFNEPINNNLSFNSTIVNNLKLKLDNSGITVKLKPAFYLQDGKQANNGWLQEIPHPITKVTWDNYAMLSPATAKKYDLKFAEDVTDQTTDMIEININGRKVTLPIFIQPGMVDDFISIELGYGRSLVGEVGANVGTNANVLLSSKDGISDKIYTNAQITKIGKKFNLISTQEHHSLDDEFVKDIHIKRHIVQEYTLPFYAEFLEKYEHVKEELKEQYANDPIKYIEELKKEKEHLLGHHHYDIKSIYPLFEYTGVKWAMGIDLNKCTGCGACIASCNVENNIPVVGKDQVAKGREMQWMRVDSYFSGTPEEPVTSLMPMLCQHCDKAPCENVCPVVATTHSPDGLNQMTYNRCVGTRYCSNNCPYKVRRFNFFDFRNDFADGYYRKDTLELLNNPEVTVRSRGVMEKCTFCIQRIQEARQNAIKENRTVRGEDVITACQEACPSSAITFGDMNDLNSEVSKIRENPLGYYVLETLNTRPNVTYISKVKNVNITTEVHSEHHH